jgi:putative two-component system hydrogenase maturation factor HypX/HoxX
VAQALLDDCLPLSVTKGKSLGMVDEVFAHKDYYESLHTFAKSKYDDDYIWAKQDYLEAHREKIEVLKEKELEVMHPEFWDEGSDFHALRQEFVYKVCPRETPKRLILRQAQEPLLNQTTSVAELAEVKENINA